MSAPQSMDNILSFPPKKNENGSSTVDYKQRRKIHPAVRRRRLFWFGCMVLFMLWFIIQIIFQQFRIWNREELLQAKAHEIQFAEAQLAKTKQSIRKLEDEDYLLELAHKIGYRYPNEENYQIVHK